MAMFENLILQGRYEACYCPSNQIDLKLTGEYSKVRETLGDRSAYMVYDPMAHDCSHRNVSIVDILKDEDLGFAVAYHLKYIIPECKYAEIGKMILINDVFRGKMKKLVKERDSSDFLEENENFSVLIKDDDEAVKIYILRKNIPPGE